MTVILFYILVIEDFSLLLIQNVLQMGLHME